MPFTCAMVLDPPRAHAGPHCCSAARTCSHSRLLEEIIRMCSMPSLAKLEIACIVGSMRWLLVTCIRQEVCGYKAHCAAKVCALAHSGMRAGLRSGKHSGMLSGTLWQIFCSTQHYDYLSLPVPGSSGSAQGITCTCQCGHRASVANDVAIWGLGSSWAWFGVGIINGLIVCKCLLQWHMHFLLSSLLIPEHNNPGNSWGVRAA